MMSRISCLFQLSADEEKALQAKYVLVEPMMCVCQYFGLILKPDGHVELLGQPHEQAENWKPFRAEDWTGVVKLYKSDSHIVGLKQDGTVIACGQNDKNQCETGGWYDIREVYVSEEATAGIDQNGKAYNTYTFRKAVQTVQPAPMRPHDLIGRHGFRKAVPTVQPAPAATAPQANTSAAPPSKTSVQAAPPFQTNVQVAPPSVEPTDEKYFVYEVNPDGSVTITGYTKKEEMLYSFLLFDDVVIPPTIAGRSVTSIGNRAFYKCEGLTSVTIPNSVTSIGIEAFSGCKRLTSINLPNSVTSIGIETFYDCENLTSVSIPNSVTSIGSYVFSGCKSLTSIAIPNSVTSIGASAFSVCEKLISVTIPNSVTSIGESAFSGCKKLISVAIPDSVTSIGASAFSWCEKLTAVTLSNSVTSIEKSTFCDCKNLTSVTIPDSAHAHT